MGTELKIADPSVLSGSERTALETNIAALIDSYRKDRYAINRLVFESVSMLTAGESYKNQISKKKGLRRFLGSITGSDKKLQDKINNSIVAAQYAAQQMLQRLAEQNLMSFDLITAVNNKLNAAVVAINEKIQRIHFNQERTDAAVYAIDQEIDGINQEINDIYAKLLVFFKQSRSDVIKLENRMAGLERNIKLLNWQNSIEYQVFQGIEYMDLNDTAKIVCLVRDFYDITQGSWNTSDLLLLKTAMATVSLSPRENINYCSFIKETAYDQPLLDYLLNGKQIEELPEPYLVPLLGMKKMELLNGEEAFIVDNIVDMFNENKIQADRKNIQGNLMCKYLCQEAQVDVDTEINHYDLVLELLFNLQMTEIPERARGYSEKSDIRVAGATGDLEERFREAAELFKNCRLKEAHPLLDELAEQGCARANALLYWILADGYKDFPADEEAANEYAARGYHMGDPIASMQYALFVSETQEERRFLSDKHKDKLREVAESGDVFASYMMGLYYQNMAMMISIENEAEAEKSYLEGISWFKNAASQNFYRAFHSVALRYYRGEGVKRNLENALSWEMKATKFSEYIRAYRIAADILYDMEDYGKAFDYYMACIEKGGNCHYDVGYMYRKNIGIPMDSWRPNDVLRALDHFEKGAALDDGRCYAAMGQMYEYGEEVEEDLQAAFEYYKEGVSLDNGTCCLELGQMYEYGLGVPQDSKQAFGYYKKGADVDFNGKCHVKLGLMYKEGNGVEKDVDEAMFNFEISMTGEGYYYLGEMYEYGEDVEKDLKGAFEYYKEGADLGDGTCYTKMGLFYENGTGVPKNMEKAVQCYQKATQYENGYGQCYLGECYLYGDGIAQNKEQAKYWLEKAAGQKVERASNLLKEYFGQ